MINDRYKILRKAGEGRSKVFCCKDIFRKDREFAIKILPSSAGKDEEKAFRDEFHLLQKLNHPNIINVFEYGTIVALNDKDLESGISTGSKFFTLEYFDGNGLYEYDHLKKESFLESVICQISSVLYYLHQSAFIYYDLKSENILVKNINGKPVIKFIDFGLASRDKNKSTARGTAEYIAPEILKNEKIDHRIDLYSLGILLYKIIYDKFPFPVPGSASKNNQLSIYQAHLEGQFDFPESHSGNKIVGIIKKLLSMDVEQRYFTSIGILKDIAPANIKIHKIEWTRIPVLTGRKDTLSVISNYIEKGDNGEVLLIKGSEGAGKSTLLNELNYKYENSILITAGQHNDAYLWRSLLRKILYTGNIFPFLNEETIQTGKELLSGGNHNILENLRSLFIKISSIGNYILLIDDFNLLSELDLEIFLQLLPLMQINKIKIVITEDSGGNSSSGINNLQSINLNPFTEAQVTEFINKSFASFFPINEVRKTIIAYSDLLPGNIEEFLKDLIILNLIEYFTDGPVMNTKPDFDKILKGSQEEIYKLRLRNLDKESMEVAILLSILNINPDIRTITGLTGKTNAELNQILKKLAEENIIHQSTILNNPQFTSRGIKEFIYTSIDNKKQHHLKISNAVEQNHLSFDRKELSRHHELAGEYEKTYEVLKPEIEEAGKASALAYKKSLLQHLSALPLSQTSQRKVKTDLGNCLFQLGEMNKCLNLINELLENPITDEEVLSLKILKGKALVVLQFINEGKEILESILDEIKEIENRNEILAEIADAEFQLMRYKQSEIIINSLLKNPSTSLLTKGKLFRIKALIELFNNNPTGSIKYFEESLSLYKEKDLLSNLAATENNLANIYHMLRDGKKAEEHWNNALRLNSSIGDVQRQGGILINFGVFYFNICNYDLAIEQYQKARDILSAFGDKNYLGFTYTNLGEVYLLICEYEKAINALTHSIRIFSEIGIVYEKSEAIFILVKTYFELKDKIKFSIALSEYEEIFSADDSKKLLDKYSYLRLLSELLINNNVDDITNIYETRDKLKANSDNFNYCNMEILLIEIFISLKEFGKALSEVNNPEYIEISDESIYFNAYRIYLIGRISENIYSNELEPAINYFIRAYEIVKDINITELTLQIINSLYDSYCSRGIVSKVNEFAKYLNHLISYISGQFSDEELRESYLSRKDIKEILNKINKAAIG